MKRETAEKRMLGYLREVVKILNQYAPNSKYITMNWSPNYGISFWNDNFQDETIKPICFYEATTEDENI